jgi:hypothetical protein
VQSACFLFIPKFEPMFFSKPFLVLVFVVCTAFSSQITRPQQTKWVVMKGGSLRVDGSTNVNKFNCVITNYSKPDTIAIQRNNQEQVHLSGAIRLNVQNFDCHNPVMTSDLRKTLKAKDFPSLVVRFVNLNRYPDLTGKQDRIKGVVAIELAGVTKRFDVDYKVFSIGEDAINLIGSRQVNFSDFNIVPPRKIGGMIQTDNELNVMFNLRLKVID